MWLLYNTVQTTLVPTVSLPGHSWMGGIRHLLQGAVACALCTDFLRNVHVKSQSMRFWSNKCFSNPLGVQTGVSGSSDSHWSPVIAADLNSGSGQVSKCSWFSANGYRLIIHPGLERWDGLPSSLYWYRGIFSTVSRHSGCQWNWLIKN